MSYVIVGEIAMSFARHLMIVSMPVIVLPPNLSVLPRGRLLKTALLEGFRSSKDRRRLNIHDKV